MFSPTLRPPVLTETESEGKKSFILTIQCCPLLSNCLSAFLPHSQVFSPRQQEDSEKSLFVLLNFRGASVHAEGGADAGRRTEERGLLVWWCVGGVGLQLSQPAGAGL